MDPIVGRLASALDFCHTFPTLRGHQIERENILHTIEREFDANKDVVFVKAAEGMGKTTLLAQFARRYSDKTLSIFVQPGNRLGYDPDFLLISLHNQARFLLSNRDIPNVEGFDDGAFQKTLFDLQKKAKRERTAYTFVVDGVDSIPANASVFRDRLLSVFPARFA